VADNSIPPKLGEAERRRSEGGGDFPLRCVPGTVGQFLSELRGDEYVGGVADIPPKVGEAERRRKVRAVGIEPTTHGLKDRCSTSELRPHAFRGDILPRRPETQKRARAQDRAAALGRAFVGIARTPAWPRLDPRHLDRTRATRRPRSAFRTWSGAKQKSPVSRHRSRSRNSPGPFMPRSPGMNMTDWMRSLSARSGA
jgi:hypothetical protein